MPEKTKIDFLTIPENTQIGILRRLIGKQILNPPNIPCSVSGRIKSGPAVLRRVQKSKAPEYSVDQPDQDRWM